MSGSDGVVVRVVQRREELATELSRIDGFLKTYAEFAGTTVDALLSGLQEQRAERIQEEAVFAPSPKPAETDEEAAGGVGMPQAEFEDMAEHLLLTHGRPLASQPLLGRFHAAGRRVGGKDELRNLTTKLWRARNRITKIPGAGYWPIRVPCEAVAYAPPPPAGTEQRRPFESGDHTQDGPPGTIEEAARTPAGGREEEPEATDEPDSQLSL